MVCVYAGEACREVFELSRCLPGGTGVGVQGCVQPCKARGFAERSVQECEYHLGWNKSQTLDVLRSLHRANGETEARGTSINCPR